MAEKGPLRRVVKRDRLTPREGRGSMRITLECGHSLLRPADQWPTKSCYCLACLQGLGVEPDPAQVGPRLLGQTGPCYWDQEAKAWVPAALVPREVLQRWIDHCESFLVSRDLGDQKVEFINEMRKYL